MMHCTSDKSHGTGRAAASALRLQRCAMLGQGMAPATGAVLRIPAALEHGVLPTGLTAPALRAFIVLIGHAADDGAVDILKPMLVDWSGTRIDAMHRFLEPLRSTVIDVAERHNADGENWFSELSYIPGERTKYAGIVKGTVSTTARAVLAETGRHGTISIAIDELWRP